MSGLARAAGARATPASAPDTADARARATAAAGDATTAQRLDASHDAAAMEHRRVPALQREEWRHALADKEASLAQLCARAAAQEQAERAAPLHAPPSAQRDAQQQATRPAAMQRDAPRRDAGATTQRSAALNSAMRREAQSAE
jgi:hypothetical protein